MTKIFTKADIEFEHFLEVLKPADGKDVALEETRVKELYAHLEDLKSQGIYVVDVTLVSTRSYNSYYSDRTHNQYMLRIVRPKYSVKVITSLYDYVTRENEFSESKIIGYFDSEDEAYKVQQSYIEDSTRDVQYDAEIQYHSPLDLEL